MTAEPHPESGRLEVVRAVDPRWWREGEIDQRPVRDVLAARDVGAVFRFLRGLGWSLTALCAQTGLSETRIRAVMRGSQRITSYDVLERVVIGLEIPRGAMGLGYATDVLPPNETDDRSSTTTSPD